MKLIVGLGNPGEKYESTRHNLGFIAVDHFLKDVTSVKRNDWKKEEKFKSDVGEITYQPKHGEEERVILAKPRTYMNNSGMAVSLLATFYKIDAADIWIVYDELDLPLGSMKIRLGGASAGHKGVESIIASLGTDKFWRFRLGIGESKNHDEMAKHVVRSADEFVIGAFDHHEAGKVRELLKRTSKALIESLEESLEAAMNRYNTK